MKRLGKQEIETRTYEVSSHYPHMLDEFEKALRTIEYCSSIGASRNIVLFIDGDGRTDFEFKRVDEKVDLQELDNMHDKLDKNEINFEFD